MRSRQYGEETEDLILAWPTIVVPDPLLVLAERA